jgi:hypothetical protein
MAARKHPKFLNINNNSLAAMIRGGTDAGVVDTFDSRDSCTIAKRQAGGKRLQPSTVIGAV